jgi:hypothetical protein
VLVRLRLRRRAGIEQQEAIFPSMS